jgi:hypothetical protein
MSPVVLFAGAVGLVLVIYLVARVLMGSGARTRVGRDGFWVQTRGLRSGSRVGYTCLVGSRRHRGNIFIESGPPEIFVYTGGAPRDVVLDVERAVSSVGDDDDDDDGVIYSSGSSGSSSGGSSAFDTSSGFAESGAADAGSASDVDGSSASAESSAADAGDAGGGYPPAY